MSQTRRERQQERMAEQAAEYLRQRELLRPKPIAVYVRAALGGGPDVLYSPLWLLIELGAVSDPRRARFSGFVE